MTHLLVDGNGVACRSWYANPRGGCVDRFSAAVHRSGLLGGLSICWDAPGSWRRERWPAYKTNRKPKPQALVAALEECRETFGGIEAPGYEADDLIATLAREIADHDPKAVVVILSDDKDMLQLVRPRCLVVNSDGDVFDVGAVEKKWGVPPRLFRHLLSWMGDTADGLPGVPGYGPKKSIPRALAGEIGDPLTYDLAELITVPKEGRHIWVAGGPFRIATQPGKALGGSNANNL